MLRKMHALHIIHGDIKPDHVMFSPSLKKFVLIDFGVSLIVEEEKGEKTLTGYIGTPFFSSP